MTKTKWMLCQVLILISTPLQGLVTQPECDRRGTLEDEVFGVAGFYFWAPCDYKLLSAAKEFCSNAGGWQHEPKTEEIDQYLKKNLPFEIYYQGLEKIDDVWTWLQGGKWNGSNPSRKENDNGDNTCSVHQNLIWRQHSCEMPKRRYICQFPSCTGNEDCNRYEDCVTSAHDNSLKFCTCKGGYFDTHCTMQYCDPECTNGKTCIVQADSTYSCQCIDGYYGEGCNNDYCVEHGNPCQHGGTCEAKRTQPYYECNCEPGFYGMNCSDDYCVEHGNPCQNGGTCEGKQTEPYYECNCEPGFYRMNCSDKYCDSNANPCLQGGNCRSTTTHPFYECDCAVGFYGKTCANNYCDENPCQNGGTCQADTSDYKCECEPGYYGATCANLITISSPGSLTGVANENLTIQLKVLTYDGPLNIDVLKNGNVADSISDVENGTVNYTLLGVEKTDNGSTYTFSASPYNGGYTRNTTTYVTVDVRAFVNVSGTTIYAPQSDNRGCKKTLICYVGGIPSPTEYGWYRNGTKLNDSSDSSVYQEIEAYKSTLYVQNAMLADQGEFTCRAANIVADESEYSYAGTNVVLTVYNTPIGVNSSSKPCSTKPEIKVDWKADSNTDDINHSFWLTSINATTAYSANKTAMNGNQVIFDGLQPFMEYKIHVEVCPESTCCIAKLNRTVHSTTDHGLPGNVSSTMEGIGAEICHVLWTMPETPADQLEGFNISWTAKIRENLPYDVDDINGHDYVLAPKLNYSINAKPNRIYRVQVSARTCAGNGNYITTAGECWTPKKGPDEVPPLTINMASNGVRQETRQVQVAMVTDESNGAISCLFVVVYKDKDGKLPNSLDDLQQLSSNALANNAEDGYIAVAINRPKLEIGKISRVTLGNGLATSCDASQTQAISQRQTATSSVIKAENIALDYRGVEYRVLSVTTTPGSDGEVFVTYNQNYEKLDDLPSFIQGKSLLWVTACVVIPLMLIAAILLGWIRHKRNATKQEYATDGHCPPLQLEEFVNEATYQNIDVTVIPLKRLKDQYIQMAADDCMLFHKQFAKLKLEAKSTAPPYTFASSDDVFKKNRYKNILPYDNNRVSLKGEGAEGYINASYIKGGKKRFIATQGPLSNTGKDFWRMIVEQGCKIIVMLAKCVENGKSKCQRYWPEAGKEICYGHCRIRNVEEKTCGRIVTTILRVQISEQEENEVTHFQYLSWPDHGVPQTTTTFLRLHKQVMTQFSAIDDETSIVVHCSAGVGRTGTFIGFDLLLGESDQQMDVYKCVIDMRQQRMDMVQTKGQYQWLHKLMMEQCYFKETDLGRTEWLNMNYHEKTSDELQLLNEFEAIYSKRLKNPSANETNAVIVRQPEDTEWLNINATFVEAYQKKARLIASEGPSHSTVEYFLRALWDNQVKEIIMLNRPAVENDQGQFCEYWPTQINSPVAYNSITITLQSTHDTRGTVERVFCLERRNQQPRTIKQHQFLHWKSVQEPEHYDLLIELIKQTVDHTNANEATVLVHCTDGLRRTGIFIAVANIIARLEMEDRIDVVRTVKDLKDIRPGIVQTLSDYKCCYDLVKQFLTPQCTYANLTSQSDTMQNEDADPIYENTNAGGDAVYQNMRSA